jgi:ribosomal protein S18 acetylase RimI-like enzyme
VCVFEKAAGGPGDMIGTIVCKADDEGAGLRGYIAMLTVRSEFRKKGIGKTLAMIGIQRMIDLGCDEIFLETEVQSVLFA